MQCHSGLSFRKAVLKEFALSERTHSDSLAFVTNKKHLKIHDQPKRNVTDGNLLFFFYF